MTTTALLHKSIEFEQSKSSPLNLLNHSKDDLLFMIMIMDSEKEALQHTIDADQYLLDNAEELAEGIAENRRRAIAENREKLETLLVWRNLFWSAWENVK